MVRKRETLHMKGKKIRTGKYKTILRNILNSTIFTVLPLVLLCLHFQFAFALAPTDEEELRRNQKRQSEEQLKQQQAPEVRLQKKRVDIDGLDLPPEKQCFRINAVVLEGERADEFDWAQVYLNKYAGRCIGREGINVIIERLTGQLINRGYTTTRIGIPEQDISAGTLRLALLPGIVRSVRFADESLRGTWRSAFPDREGDLLNLRDLEQGLEQMKRLPYQDVDIEIVPAEKPGESDVILKIKRQKPWRISLALDNSGSETTGKLQGSGTFSFDNPLGINDLFYVSYYHDADGQGAERHSEGGTIHYSIPFGYWSAGFTGNLSTYHQTVQGAIERLAYTGRSESFEFSLQRLVYRDQVSKTSLQGKIIRRFSRTWLNDVEIEVQRRDSTALELAAIHRRYLGPVQLDLTIAHRQGIHAFGAGGDGPLREPDGPTEFYKIETIDFGILAPFAISDVKLVYRGQFRGQYTRSPLFISEQFSIGNRYTVRGFDGENTLLAERGWLVRNEIGIPIFKTGQELYGAIDHGEVSGPSARMLIGKRLTGGGFGLRGVYKGFTYDVFTGWPVWKPEGFRIAQQAFYFQAALQF